MSISTFSQMGGTAGAPQSSDAEMDQIRELLVGEQQRQLEARLKELEEDIARRFDELTARIDALGQETIAGRRSAFEELSRGVMELGERVRNLSKS